MSPRRKTVKPKYKLVSRHLKPGEHLRYRRLNGKPSKYDRKRKLIVEVWNEKGRVGVKNRPDKKGNPIAYRITARQKSFMSIREAPYFKKQVKLPRTALSFQLDSRSPIIEQLRTVGIDESLIALADLKGAITASFIIKIPKTGEELERTPEIFVSDDQGDQSQEFLLDRICSVILSVLWKYSKRMSSKKYAPKYRHKYAMVRKAYVEVRIKS